VDTEVTSVKMGSKFEVNGIIDFLPAFARINFLVSDIVGVMQFLKSLKMLDIIILGSPRLL